MRDQYAGDISDFFKFSFLRALASKADIKLGIGWYFVDVHDGRADGKHQEYLSKRGEFKALDNHRERKKEEHIFIQFKEEEKLLEELANNRSTYHSPFVTS